MSTIGSTLLDRQAIWAFVFDCLAVRAGVGTHLPMFSTGNDLLISDLKSTVSCVFFRVGYR